MNEKKAKIARRQARADVERVRESTGAEPPHREYETVDNCRKTVEAGDGRRLKVSAGQIRLTSRSARSHYKRIKREMEARR